MVPKRIRITAQAVVMEIELNESRTPEQIWNALPLSGPVSTWGEEIYFRISVKALPEDEKELVELGDVAYWSPGSAFCIFFGPTPTSQDDEIRPASAVNED